jgi:hypothetical protein
MCCFDLEPHDSQLLELVVSDGSKIQKFDSASAMYVNDVWFLDVRAFIFVFYSLFICSTTMLTLTKEMITFMENVFGYVFWFHEKVTR